MYLLTYLLIYLILYILHRFGDTAAYRSKNRQNRPFEPTPGSETPLAEGNTCDFFDEPYLARE